MASQRLQVQQATLTGVGNNDNEVEIWVPGGHSQRKRSSKGISDDVDRLRSDFTFAGDSFLNKIQEA